MKDDVKDSTTTATTDKKLKTINPTTEEVLNEYTIISKEQLNDTVKKSKNAFLEWKKDIDKRADFLYAFAKELRKNKENLAKTATQEMGKAIKEARSEVEKCAWTVEYYADHGKIFANDEVVNTDARKSIITFQPFGVIGRIMPLIPRHTMNN
jgi:succinate-semialdehyde dehydrogenase/glutarate-semialdehyde dehydrogenase/succinyl-CoA reductase